MARHIIIVGLLGFLVLLLGMCSVAHGAISSKISSQITKANAKGPYVGIATTSVSEIDALSESGKFLPDAEQPYIDVFGKRFRFGELQGLRVIIFVTGHSFENAGRIAELLLALFEVKGVVIYGNAGKADPRLQLGDISFPRYWAYTGEWNWERFQHPNATKLQVEAGVGGDTPSYAYLKLYKYNDPTTVNGAPVLNYLSKISYHAQEYFPEGQTPEVGKKTFWFPTSKKYFKLATQLEELELEQCVNETFCLPTKPVAARAYRGSSSSIVVNNVAYRDFLYSTFGATPIDTSSAAVGLACFEKRIPYIAFRALTNSADGSKSDILKALATKNLVTVVLKFISLLASPVQTF